MIEKPAIFGERLLFFRRRLGLTQEKVAELVSKHSGISIHSSELSRWERGSTKPPRMEIILALIKVLQLSKEDERTFTIAAGFSPSIVQWTSFEPKKYPEVTGSPAERLQGSYGYWPVWELDNGGGIIAANLLAFRIWRALPEYIEITEEVRNRLLGVNFFDLITRTENFCRIGMNLHEPNDFWPTIIAVYKKMHDALPTRTQAAFERRIDAHQVLGHLLRHAPVDINHEWEYHLSIMPAAPAPKFDEAKFYMEYKINLERISKDGIDTGFLVTAQPIGRYTIDRIRQRYEDIKERYGEKDKPFTAFVQQIADTHVVEEAKRTPSYYPAIHPNKYWMVVLENTVFLKIYGYPRDAKLFYGHPLFHWLFSPETRALAGEPTKQQLQQLLRAPVRQFIENTKDFEKQKPIPKEYQQVKDYLFAQLRQEGLEALFDEILAEVTQQQAPTYKENSVWFHLHMRCPYTTLFPLSFEVVSRMPYDIDQDYRITLVPTNAATKTALMLLTCEDKLELLDRIGIAEEQLYWLLVLIQTIRIGFMKGKGDSGWKPDIEFKELFVTLQHGDDRLSLKLAISQLLLDEDGEQRRVGIIAMLKAFTKELALDAYTFLCSTFPTPDEAQAQVIEEPKEESRK